MLRQALLGLAVMSACVATPVYGQEAKLKLKFKEGEKFWVEEVSSMKQDMTVMGQAVNMKMKTTTITSYAVKKVTPDSVVLDMKIEDVKLDVEGAPGGAGIDQLATKTKGANLIITMSHDGKVKKVDGVSEFLKQMAGEDETAKLMKEFLSEDTFTKSLENAFGFIPEKTVKVGDTWNRETKLSMGPLGGFKINNNFTYAGKKDSGDGIDGKFTMEWSAAKGEGALGGLFKVVKSDMKGDGTATYVFDTAKGRPGTTVTKMKMQGSMTIDVGGMELPMMMAMEVDSTSRVVDTNPLKK
jgi:Family of unknown function (DUF6263)